jgi:hypothetical protein
MREGVGAGVKGRSWVWKKPPDVVFYGWRVAADVRTLGEMG